MKIAICDDNQIDIDTTKQTVFEYISTLQFNSEITVKTFQSGLDLLRLDNHKIDFDLFILDIIMPGIGGIELAEEIRQKNKHSKIIFLTASSEFAVRSYHVDAFYYLIKPFQKEEFLTVIKTALMSIEKEKSSSILIKDKKSMLRIKPHTITYIESIKHRVYFHLSNGEIASCYGKMEEYIHLLSQDKRFMHCHRSFMVNMNFIASLEKNYFILSDKALVPISRNIYQTVKTRYINYFFQQGNEVMV